MSDYHRISNASRALASARKVRTKRVDALRGCNLVSCPNLGFLASHLSHLDVSYNCIATLGPEIGVLVNLEFLKADHNAIRLLGPDVGRAEKLETLLLQGNRLATLPDEMGRLKNLRALNVNGNRLETISAHILGLPSLKRLDCIRNPLVFPDRSVAVSGLDATRRKYRIQTVDFPDAAIESDLEDSCFESSDEQDLTTSSLCGEKLFIDCSHHHNHVTIKTKYARALIPVTDGRPDRFYIRTIRSSFYWPHLEANEMLASPIIAVEPHGSHFEKLDPAIIWIKHCGSLERNQKIVPLISDTDTHRIPTWHPIDAKDFFVNRHHVIIKTTHFSLFTVKIFDPFPEVTQHIEAGSSATILLPTFPDLKIHIPGTCVDNNVTVTLRVLPDSNTDPSLASPIISVTPHGYHFNANSPNPIEVTLPIPNLAKIKKGSTSIRLFHSNADKKIWEVWPGPIDLRTNGPHGVLTFTTSHFSYFKALFDTCILLLREAKLGATYYYNQLRGFNVQLMCKALMTDIGDDLSFSVCLMCYRFGQEPISIGNYPITLASAQQKILRVGSVQVELKGHVNGLAEVEESLVKDIDFDGRDFTVEFAVKGKASMPKWGVLGRIFVESLINGQYKFDLNLVLAKNSKEPEPVSKSDDDELTDLELTLAKELEDQLPLDGLQSVSDELDLTLPQSASFIGMVQAAKQSGISANQLGRAVQRYTKRQRKYSSQSSSDEQDESMWSRGARFGPIASTPHRKPYRPVRRKRGRYSSDTDNEEIGSECLIELSDHLGKDWYRLGLRLGFETQELREIEHSSNSLKEISYEMLNAWHRREGENCTYEELYRALVKERLWGLVRHVEKARHVENPK